MRYERRKKRMDFKVDLRDRIRNVLIKCRIEAKLTQTDVGKIVGKTKNAVASWEQGLSLPDITTLYRLSKYYGKSLEYMYGEEGNKE